jgi:DNA-directed RNA polymerase subunit E'/Rpb7
MCKENIKLEPKYVNSNFKNELLNRLKSKVEGVCSKHGYIKHNTIELYKVAPGVVELISLAGHVVYDVYFYADVCNPLVGSIVKARVANINRFAILAEAGYVLDNEQHNVLQIIVAKHSISIQSDVDLETLKIGDDIKVEIISKKNELGEKKISAIGKVIKETKAVVERSRKGVLEDAIDNDQDEDEEVYDEETEGDGDDENEEDAEADNEDEDIENEEDETKHGGSEFFSDDDSFFSEEVEDFDADDKESSSVLSDNDIE